LEKDSRLFERRLAVSYQQSALSKTRRKQKKTVKSFVQAVSFFDEWKIALLQSKVEVL